MTRRAEQRVGVPRGRPGRRSAALAAHDQLHLPPELRAELERGREDIERALTLAALTEARDGEG